MRNLRVACWNAGCLSGKDGELESVLVEYDLDFIFVSETWAQPYSIAPPDDAYIYWCPYPRRAAETGHYPYGVALLMGRNVQRRDVRIIPGKDGLTVWWVYKGILFGGIYLPPEASRDYCTELLEAPVSVNGIERRVLVGDFNMRLGEQTGDSERSPRANALASWFSDRRLVLCNSDLGVPTFVRNGTVAGTSIVDQVWTTLGTELHIDTRVIADDDIGGSEHRLVYTEILLLEDDVTDESGPEGQETLKLTRFKDERVREAYREATHHYFHGLTRYYSETARLIPLGTPETQREDIEEMNRMIKDETTRIAKAVLGLRTKVPRHLTGLLKDPAVILAKRRRRRAFIDINRSPASEELWEEYKDARKEQKRAIQSAKERLFWEFADRFEKLEDTDRSQLIAAMVRKRTRGKNSLLSADSQSLEAYATHFEGQFARREFHTGAQAETEARCLGVDFTITDDELRKLMRTLPKGKAPGPSGFRNELLVFGGQNVASCIREMFEACWKVGMVPVEWTRATLVPVPKKGDLSLIKNYRPISLTETLRKLYERCLLKMLLDYLEPYDIAQGGFRHKRSTVDSIASLHEAILQRKATTGKYPIVAYLDIQAAYDTVERSILWREVAERGFNHELLVALKELFDHNKSCVSLQGAKSREIEQPVGLLQGSILSPLLYAAFINKLPGRLREHSSFRLYTERIASFFYADDIAIVADSPAQLQMMLRTCEEFSIDYCFRFNPGKCEIVGGREEDLPLYQLYGSPLKLSLSFTYLGMRMTTEGIDGPEHVRLMTVKTLDALNLIRSLGFNGWGFSTEVKKRLYETFIRPRLEYGLQLISPCRIVLKMLETTQHIALATMFSVSRTSSMASLRALSGIQSMEQRWRELNCKWNLRLGYLGRSFMVHHALKASQQRGIKGSCFLLDRLNPMMRAYRDATIWSGQGRVAPEEMLEKFEVVRRLSRKRDRAQLWTGKTATQVAMISPRPKVTALRIDSLVTRRARRLLCLFVLNRHLGKPVRCLNCPRGRTTPAHVKACYGREPWNCWTAGRDVECVGKVADMLQKCKGFALRDWTTTLARERIAEEEKELVRVADREGFRLRTGAHAYWRYHATHAE